MDTPESIKSFAGFYVEKSWEDYTPEELGTWVHLLIKRSKHRSTKEKALKDLTDAQNYLNMMQEHINTRLEEVETIFGEEINGD